jgi:ribosomal protein S18 acetylase RimI-like enzyme
MHLTNETSRLDCRFLRSDEFTDIHKTFLEGFSDYLIKFELTERQFQNHITLNAVDLNRSAGCFVDHRAVGLSLNGFGSWEGIRTVYDAGTAVVPDYRRRGVSRSMFDWMIPMFTNEGFGQFLLEVITHNDPAVKLYEQLGFRKTRELLLLQAETSLRLGHRAPSEIEIREIHRHENIP